MATPWTGAEKAFGALLLGVLLVFALTYILGGSGNVGVLWTRFWLTSMSLIGRYAAHAAMFIAGWALAQVASLPTIIVPLRRGHNEAPKRRRIWYKPGSLKRNGSHWEWRQWNGKTGRVNANYMLSRGMFGGYWVIAPVEPIETGRSVVYETASLEATHSALQLEQIRELSNEIGRLRLEKRRPA